MADKEKVLFSRGPRETMPSSKVPGTIYITTNTGEMFLDDTDTSRIQIGPSPADVRSLGVSGASVGQIVKIKAVDESGKPTAWEAVEFPEQVQSDYEQNDSSSKDYIKNRPCYEATETTDIAGTSITIDASVSSVTHDFIPLQVGQEWKVTTNTGSEFTAVVQENEQGEPYLGSPDTTSGSYPFYIRANEAVCNSSWVLMQNITSLTLTCLSGTYTQGVIKKIDPKFLPDVSSLLVVNLTMNGGDNITADKTFSEIKAAHDDGKVVDAKFADAIVPLCSISDSEAFFAVTQANSGEVFTASLTCTSDNVWSMSWNGFDAHTLGISGASAGQTVTIKAVDAAGIPTEWETTDKMDKSNPTGTGSFSLNRKSGTVIGENSHAEGNSTTASGRYGSHAEGSNTTASGQSSHAEGYYTTASGDYSHSEGYCTTASGDSSHAEGSNTIASVGNSHAEGAVTTASGYASHAEGNSTTASGQSSHAEGNGTKSSSANQHAQGKYNIEDSKNTYADIIGNGTRANKRSNAATVDWSGNAWYAGDVYVGSTSGTNKDAGSKKLATEEYVDSAVSGGGGTDTSLGLTGATVGQVPVVKSVDVNGKPTEWEAGDSKPFVVTVTYGDNDTLTADKTHAEIVAAYTKGVQINAKIVNYPGFNAPSILPLYVNISDEMFMFSGSGVVDGSAMAMTAIDTNGNWRVELAELAKLTDIPTSLKNPQSLVLASEGESKVYDGSSAVNVVIPCNTKVMTVTAAGAKGDGVTDDTAAFKTALENYRNVFVPGGTYKLTEGITIRDACKLELAPDAVLNFTQTTGNCISMKMSAYLCGNHAVIEVPYGFSGNVIYVSTALNTSVTDVPPFTKWDPQWKTGRYLTDVSISKQDSRGFHYSIDGGCSGTAVYIEADGSATSKFIWGLNFSGLRIAGAFSYGIHAKTIGSGYNHEMRLEALIDACEIGLCLEDCNNAYASVTVQPRAALTTGGENVVYAKYGIQLIRSRNTDLSGARVWDWNSNTSLWTSASDCEYQHITMVGNCSGTILNDFLYYEMPSYDIRSLIYTDTPANLEKITILQEPFTRWFKPIDNKPMFYDGSANNELLLKSAFDAAFQTEMVANFDNKLLKSANADGTIFNGTGYQSGAGWSTDGVTLNTGSEYAEITCTGFIPCAENAVIRIKGMSFASGNDYCRVVLFDSSKAKLMHVNRANLISNASSYYINNYSETEDGCQFTIVSASAAYFKVNVFTSTLSSSPAITVNEEMTYSQEGYLADGIKVKKTAVEGLDETSLGITGASAGQIIKVKSVDASGNPTEWESVDFSPATLKTWTEADLGGTT